MEAGLIAASLSAAALMLIGYGGARRKSRFYFNEDCFGRHGEKNDGLFSFSAGQNNRTHAHRVSGRARPAPRRSRTAALPRAPRRPRLFSGPVGGGAGCLF